MGHFCEYENYDGLGLAELVRRREVSPVELVEAAIERIEALNPQVNAVIHKMYEQGLATAGGELPDGPFKGVPFLLKDLVMAYAGVPMRAGSRFFNQFVPDFDSELVKRYRAAGLVILGKTNVPELGITPFTEPELFGPCRNPWDLSRTPGGSSGGSAAAVAARMVPLASGSDGGGSIRIPAACCGLFGLKPTRGRTPTGPHMGEIWHGASCEHVITRSVRDSAAILDITNGPDVGAPNYPPPPKGPFLEEVGTNPGQLRIAFTSEPWLGHSVHEDCLKALAATVELLKGLGHEVMEAGPKIDRSAFTEAFLTMLYGEIGADIAEGEALLGRKAGYGDFEAATWVLGLLGRQISAAEFSRAIQRLQRIGRQVGQFFEGYDLLLTPTLASPPVLIGALKPKPNELFGQKLLGRLRAGRLLNSLKSLDNSTSRVFDFIPYTPVFNITGQPAMSVPLYWNEAGLPVGLQFVARFADEATLFRLAGQLEQASPWCDRIPGMVADRAGGRAVGLGY